MAEADQKTILLVEDEAIIAMVEKQILEGQGYRVRTVESGEAALDAVEAHPDINLVLMDINLGNGIDGTEAARRILARRELPLVFLSSHTEAEIVEKTEGITSYGYIVKNSGKTVLIASIKMAFRLFEARNALRQREMHYHSLFEDAIGPVWIEDFSAFKRRVDELRREGINDFRSWLAAHPAVLPEFADLIGIVDMNARALASVGLSAKMDIPRTLRSFLGPESWGFFADELSALAEGQQHFEAEIIDASHQTGQTRYHLLSLTVSAGHEQDLSRVQVMLHDLSNLYHAQAELQIQTRLHELLVELSMTFINLPMDGESLAIQTALEKMARLVGADRAYVFRYDHARQLAVNTHEWCAAGITAQIHNLQDLLLANIADALAEHQLGKTHYVADVSALPQGSLRTVLEPQGIKSMLAIPMLLDRICIGCVGFDYVRSHHCCSTIEQELLSIFAQMLVNIDLRGQAATALSLSHAELQAIYDYAPVLLCVLDAQRRVLYANQAFTAFTGVAEADLKSGQACGVFGCINALDNPRGCGFGQRCHTCELLAAIEDTFLTGKGHRNVSYASTWARQGQRTAITMLGSTALIESKGEPRLLLCLYDISERVQAEERIQRLLHEKELLLKETHHRVKNNMGVIYSLLSLQADGEQDQTNRLTLEIAASRVKSLMLLYDKLYKAEHHGELNVNAFLVPLIAEMTGTQLYGKAVTTTAQIDDFVASAQTLSSIALIMNEMISNSMKHAFVDITDPLISVMVHKNDDTAILEYADNGIGLPANVDTINSTGFGIRLIGLLVDQLQGSVSIDRNHGTRYRIQFRVDRADSGQDSRSTTQTIPA
jgi:two-component sensor histidine kinase/CheY-like chemotaxis protein